MHKRFVPIILLAIFCAMPVLAQDEWYLDQPISEIRFSGLSTISENDLTGVVEPFIDQPLNEALLLDLQRRLYNLEYFDLITPNPVASGENGDVLILEFIVEERPVITEIRFDGNSKIRRETLRDEIILKGGDFVSRAQARLDLDSIIALYKERGFPGITASFEFQDDPLGGGRDQVLVFTIEEGYQTNVRSITFDGISFATANKLKSLLTTKEQGLFNSGSFQRANLEIDRQAILQYYGENGYIDARVLDIKQDTVVDEDQNRQFIDITYYIEEGNAWFFGGIDFQGNSIIETEQLRSQMRLDEGDVLNRLMLQAGFQSISDQYYQIGYIFNSFDIQQERDETLRQIHFTMVISEADQAYIGNIVVRGNTKTADEIIYRELPFKSGDVFSASLIRQGISNLYNTGYFAQVPTIDTPQGTEAGLMDIIITVEEGQTTDVRFGLSIGGDDEIPVSGLLTWNDTNFLGNGQSIGVDLTVSSSAQQLAFNFDDGWLFGDRWSGGASVYFNRLYRDDGLQDLEGPLFDDDDDNAVPDPYTGAYVFSDDTTYNSVAYAAGMYFPGTPTADEIDDYDLVTDYEYYGGSSSVDDEYLMEYEQYTIGASFSTGVRRQSPIGWVGLSSAISTNFETILYDDTIYRPYDADRRENLGVWMVTNTLGLTASLDGRDVSFNPQSGYYFEQGFKFTGGLLGGSQNFIRSDSTAQGYVTLANVDITDDYTFKTILAMNSTFTVLLPQFISYSGDTFEASKYYLATNGMTIARGWDTMEDGQALWNNWIELRFPLSEQFVWLDIYGEAVRFVEDREDMFTSGWDNWYFGVGAGLRFTIQQFPFRLYLAKLFQVDDSTGAIEWEEGNVFVNDDVDGSGLSLIFSVSLY